MSDMRDRIAEYSKLLALGSSVSYTEAERRSGEFLSALAMVTDWKHLMNGTKIKLISVQTSVYAQEMSKGQAKTVTENKLTAEASKAYTEAREALEEIENDVSYLKAYYEIFTNGHIFYRNMAKGVME